MTTEQWLKHSQNKLGHTGFSTARLDSLVLICHVLNTNKAQILADDTTKLTKTQLSKLNKLLQKRIEARPVAQIVGKKEFYGHEFLVNRSVLVPRPESESFIELIAKLRTTQKIHNIIDIGTGSGALAITIKLKWPDLYVTASDISRGALKVAAKNSIRHSAAITLKHQTLLDGDKEGYDLVVANLPYVPKTAEFTNEPSIMFEPKIALFSGNSGLSHYAKLFKQLSPKHIRFVMTESLVFQHDAITVLADKAGYKLLATEGLVQMFSKIERQ